MIVRTLSWSLVLALAASAAMAGDDAKPEGKSKLYHVVAFKFKEGTTDAQKQEIAEAFRALKKKIKLVKDYVGGSSVSLEKLNKDYEHCSVLEFKSMADLKAYTEHPDHKAFVEMLKPHMAEAFVFDFWD
jgi:quinol monooxygenase YgiN